MGTPIDAPGERPSYSEAFDFAIGLVAAVPATAPGRQDFVPADVAEFLVRWNLPEPKTASRRVETLMLIGAPGTGKTRFARLIWLHRAWCRAPCELRRKAQAELDRWLRERRDPLNIMRGDVGTALSKRYGWKEAPLPNVVGSLFESLLFGYVGGAFTGANAKDTPGVLTWPDRDGPSRKDVFLDEVTEVAGDLQPKLLGVLSTGEFTPVGGKASHPLVDRLIFASNRDLREAAGKTLRRDLYERIATPCLEIRGIDKYTPDAFETLVRSLVAQISADLDWQGAPIHLPDADLADLRGLSWPGNVRQIEKVMEDFVRAYVMDRTGRRPLEVAAEIAPLFDSPKPPQPGAGDVDRIAREFCERAFESAAEKPEQSLTPSALMKRLVDAHLPAKRVLEIFDEVYRGFDWPRDTPCVNHKEWQKYRGSRGRE